MKRTDLIRKIKKAGCKLIRHGGRHDWYENPNTGQTQAVPRHSEVGETLAKQILKKLGA